MTGRLFAAVAALCVAPAVQLAAAVGFEGTWKATVPGPSGQSGLPVTFAFQVADGHVRGTVSTSERTFSLVDLKIEGSSIRFAVEGEEQNRYSGTLSGDAIKMQVKYPSHENGTRTWNFTMTRAAEAGTAAAIEGAWDGDVPRAGGRTIAARFSFRASGGVLSGHVQAVGDDFPIVKGTIADSTIAFKVGGTQGDYAGTVDGDQLSMTVKYSGGEAGTQTLRFVLTRAR